VTLSSGGFVDLNGLPQWVAVHADGPAKPILVVLHGGPGSAMSLLHDSMFKRFEATFTVVHWDQRGAGRTLQRNRHDPRPLTVALMTADGVALLEHLRARLPGRPIVLLGISWGSLLGAEIARARPDMVTILVGAGQVVDMVRGEEMSWRFAVGQARRNRDRKRAARVEADGAGPERPLAALLRQRKLLFAGMPKAERRFFRSMPLTMIKAAWPSLTNLCWWVRGGRHSITRLWPELLTWSLEDGGLTFETPVVVVQGAVDMQTPTPLVSEIFPRLRAPAKALVLIDGAGHGVFATHAEAFRNAVTDQVAEVLAAVQRTAA
jgi:pimeloyl-ACP methyl ester carboxylesterase